jgi:Na+/proline symporter
MSLDINAAIFITFIVGNFIFGLWTSRGVTTLRGYAIGDKDFSTATLVATIVATWVGGSFFLAIIAETYANGVGYIYITLAGDFISLLLVGTLLAPRMGEFYR